MFNNTCLIGAVVGALLAAHGQAIGADPVPFPVIYKGENPTITMQVIGTYRGGWFSNKTPAGPEYDRSTNRLFVGSVDRKAVEALDISDLIAAGERQQPLSTPAFRIDLTAWGGEPNSIAVRKGVVAVTVKNHDDPSQQHYVLLFNTDGARLSGPIPIDRASRVAFTPNGRKLAVTLSSGPEWDPIQSKVVYYKDGVSIIDFGSVNWSDCRKVPENCNLRIPDPIPVADFTPFDARREDLIRSGVRLLAPDPNVAVSDALRSESITISQDSRTAWVPLPRNNAVAVMDLQIPRVTDVFALGSKDHSKPGNGFDASDKDGKINIATWPISSFYEAGYIAVAGRGAQRFLVMASQGDPWDEDWFREKFRLGGDLPNYPPLPLNPTEFPNASALQLNKNLGRLNVTTLSGDINGDGMFERIYMVGSRSFSIRDLHNKLIFDSGDDFEQITATALPNNFNCAEDSNTFDDRSDDRGPEPKHISVGTIGGHDYAFIGLERISGIIVYDITDRTAPRFQLYFNNRNFNVEPRMVCGGKAGHQLDPGAQITCPEAGDLSTEGFVFIRQDESPIHAPLLAVTHETSDSTTLYRIDPIER